LPSAFPSTTNASKPNICGSLVRVWLNILIKLSHIVLYIF
jgi:hypothetical protein